MLMVIVAGANEYELGADFSANARYNCAYSPIAIPYCGFDISWHFYPILLVLSKTEAWRKRITHKSSILVSRFECLP